jgi:hypothetical protein
MYRINLVRKKIRRKKTERAIPMMKIQLIVNTLRLRNGLPAASHQLQAEKIRSSGSVAHFTGTARCMAAEQSACDN